MRVLGMISGTSLDGVDAAVVDLTLTGTALEMEVVAHQSVAYPSALRAELVAALPPAPATAAALCRLDSLVGQAFADVAAGLVEQVGPVDAVCSHGQTVYHWVEDGQARGTLQIGQPAWTAERLGVPVVSDLRPRDVAAGGQGAPLVPLLDQLVLAGTGVPAAALNLGGIANLTVVRPGHAPYGYDIGPANALVDALVRQRRLHGCGYDQDGRIAAGGTVSAALLAELLDEPYYRLEPPKSTGKELFTTSYLDQFPAATGLSGPDLVATLTRLTAQTVADAVRSADVTRLYVSGGGARNPVLMSWLTELVGPVEVLGTDDLGLPGDAKEAIAFALLGWCTLHGLPGSVPSVTGAAGPRVLGSVTPGAGPLSLPAPVPQVTSATCRVVR